jgi:pimeloyl-ACP methyl ester carboxylesterase
MRLAQSVDGFRLAYDRTGDGPPVILLHGWPGDRTDYQEVTPLVAGLADVIVPDLRGFGQSDKHPVDPGTGYSAAAQARSVVALIRELGLDQPVLAGYDIGGRIAQAIARAEPSLVSGLVLSPPLPGIGDRILSPAAQREFWYQPYHQLELSSDLIDGRPELVHAYLRHFWSHWSGPDFEPTDAHLDHLVNGYAQPGAFPTWVLWPTHDPLFPIDWSDRIGDYFADATLTRLDRSGHFTPVERAREFAAAVAAAVTAR